MAENITLSNGALSAVVSLSGGWLERLDSNSKPLLYPKSSLTAADGSTKVRGGSHVCLPNFGPGGESGQNQHGFGREQVWAISDQAVDQATITLSNGPGDYADMSSELSYALRADGIIMRLTTTNNGDRALRVAPGFHPYFDLPTNTENLSVDNQSYAMTDVAEAVFLPTKPHELRIPGRNFAVQADSLPQWVLWSDGLGEYLCLDPTQAGFSFLNEASETELLMPGQTRSWSLQITVEAIAA
ncbi:hypothetical protein BH09PAT3_BH09PAT3_7210 [soil metagenome]